MNTYSCFKQKEYNFALQIQADFFSINDTHEL